MKKSNTSDAKLKKLGELDAVKRIGNNIINDFRLLRKNGKNPEPESFYEIWVKQNLTSRFPKKYEPVLWKHFVNSLFDKVINE